MRKLLAAWLLIMSAMFGPADAQQVNMYWNTGGTGFSAWQPVSAANPLPISGSFSATGFPGTTQTTGTPISVTTGGVTGTLPAGTVVVASNVGTTNNAYCKLGASATTSDQLIAPNSWFGFTVGSNTQLTCITSTSTTTVNMVGGAGLPTGAGGGGGSGGGAVTLASGAVASGAYSSGSIASGAFASGSIGSGAVASGAIASGAVASGAVSAGALATGAAVDGWDITQGTKSDAACASGATTPCSVEARLAHIETLAAAAIPCLAGTAFNTNAAITTGNVGATNCDVNGGLYVNLGTQLGTAGTANAKVLSVQGIASMTPISANIAQVNGVTVLTGTGATGTGAQRVTVATDQATNAGAALNLGGVGVVNGGNYYVTVAASQTAQVLQSSTGATGDYLSHCVIQPTTTSAGTVIIYDNATTIFTFTIGTLSNLVPFTIPVGAVSRSGAWKVTTGASETATCVGKFS
jgi:hypothetical protein